MHPALSIIFFSTLSGAGFGLVAVTSLTGQPDGSSVILAYPLFAPLFVGGALASIGLFCSVAHLRRPDRAWRAFSQWRSSWLSREGIFAVAALLLLVPLAFANQIDSTLAIVLGLLASALSVLTVFATSMIYAQIRAVPAWRTALTPVLYLSFAASGGILAAAVLTSLFSLIAATQGLYQSAARGQAFDGFAAVASMAIFMAWIVQSVWWIRLKRTGTGPSTTQSATGLERFGPTRLLEPPHTGSNYLTDEMDFVVGRRHASKLRILSLLCGGLLPLLLLLSTQISDLPISWQFVLASLAFIFHLFGVGLSRWLFFAEARHTVSLYY